MFLSACVDRFSVPMRLRCLRCVRCVWLKTAPFGITEPSTKLSVNIQKIIEQLCEPLSLFDYDADSPITIYFIDEC